MKLLEQDMLNKLARTRTVQVVIAAATGVIVGLIVYSVSRVTGRNLFLITGGVAGIVAVIVIQVYWRAAKLTEVKVTIPQFSEFTFVVNNEARQVAWRLFVETVTRVATQELDEEQGLLREALNSLYSLFAITRELLKGSRPSVPAPGGQTVEHMAITMLNWELRPMLSTWHPQLLRYEKKNPGQPESNWEDAQACRAELRVTQDHLREYCLGFARLAGVRKAEEMITPAGPIPRDRQP